MGQSAYKAARNLRKRQTEAEKAFWELVRNRKFLNLKFHRQFPIEFEWNDQKRFFIADFYCHELRLIVEIDGGIHELQKDYDKIRTLILNTMNLGIVRFSNEDVLSETGKVIRKLEGLVETLKNLLPTPTTIGRG